MKSATRNRIGRLFPVVGPLVLALSASAVEAGADAGTFRRTNGEARWTAINLGLTGTPAFVVTVDPSTPATLYAGTDSGGVFRSVNAGGSWTGVNNGLTSLTINTLAIDPSTPATLYAGTDGGGAFKTTDAGESWTAINSGLTRPYVLALAVDPSAPATLYAGTDDGLFKSTNRGESWMPVNTGLTNTFVISLALDPSTPGTLYAGTDGGLFKSTNGGANWTESRPGSAIWSVAIDPSVPSTLYVASEPIDQPGVVYKSTNGGVNWTESLDGPVVDALVIDPRSPATIYAGATTGVFTSNDGGATWTEMNAGLTDPYVEGLAIDPSNPARIYAATDGGVYVYQTTERPIERRILPVVGSTPGANGTFFRTSVQLNNPGSVAPMSGRIVFHPSGAAGGDSDPALSYSLAPGQTQSIADLLPAMGTSGLGSADIEITSGGVPAATARVFNDAGAAGTTGFTEQPLRADEALRSGQTGVLLIPPDFAVARFNVGIRTLDDGASVTFTLRDAAGAVVGSRNRALPSNYHQQQDATGFLSVLELPPGGSISITVNSGAAIVYGATVDNRTGDPSLQIARATP